MLFCNHINRFSPSKNQMFFCNHINRFSLQKTKCSFVFIQIISYFLLYDKPAFPIRKELFAFSTLPTNSSSEICTKKKNMPQSIRHILLFSRFILPAQFATPDKAGTPDINQKAKESTKTFPDRNHKTLVSICVLPPHHWHRADTLSESIRK